MASLRDSLPKDRPANAGDVLAYLSRTFVGPDDPDTRFFEWLSEAASQPGGIRRATDALGVTVEPGAGFARRLRDAVVPALRRTGKHGST